MPGSGIHEGVLAEAAGVVVGQAGPGAPPAAGSTVAVAHGEGGSLLWNAGQALHAGARGEHMWVVLPRKF